MSDALSTDWTQRLPPFNLDFFTLPDVKAVQVDVRGDPLDEDSAAHIAVGRILNPDGTDQGSLAEFVEAWVKHDDTSELLRSKIPSGYTGTISVDIPFIPGTALQIRNGATREISRIHVSAVCHRNVSRVSLSARAYGGAPVAYGAASVLGHTARLVAVERAPGDRRLGITLEKNQRRRQPRRK